jgi:hypothetical protein
VADHDEVRSCDVFEQIWGNLNFELPGERLRMILGGWVLDYPMELTVASIYRDRSRAQRIRAADRDR